MSDTFASDTFADDTLASGTFGTSRSLERSPERDAAITAMLPYVEDLGWTVRALTEAAGPDADLLFPGGAAEMVEAYCDLADRWMEADAALLGLDAMRTSERVRAVVAARFARNEPWRGAVRRALGVLGLPGHAAATLRCTGRTVDAVWRAAGDTSSGFGWYSKRAILAGVYGATLLFWLADGSDGSEDTLAFLDRRLARVGRFSRTMARLRRTGRPS